MLRHRPIEGPKDAAAVRSSLHPRSASRKAAYGDGQAAAPCKAARALNQLGVWCVLRALWLQASLGTASWSSVCCALVRVSN